MEWSLKEDLRDCLVAAAPYGGPIGRAQALRLCAGAGAPWAHRAGTVLSPQAVARTQRPIPPAALLKNNARKEKSPSARPLLEIYSASGLLLASMPVSWPRGGRPHL